MLRESFSASRNKSIVVLLILALIQVNVGAQAREVFNTKSSGYLLCVNAATKVVTFPGKSACPKGTKKLVIGARGATGTNGLPGVAGLPGKDGINGKDGKTLWNGKIDPVNELGSPGDMFINTATNTLFGPKGVNSGWPVGVSMVGPKGERGATGPAGPAGPAGATGGAGAPAAPAFTLSSSAETRTVNTVATGFNILSTGGPITSFAISATPPGMSFNPSTGVLSGTPTSVAVPTTYIITAINATGSATRTFTLTVTTNIVFTVGQTGPGGGKIFYVAPTPFTCGVARVSACTYLEAAPSSWFSDTASAYYEAGADPRPTWASEPYFAAAVDNPSEPKTAKATAIGWGYHNTRAIIGQGNTDVAATLADSYTAIISGIVFDDWYLPSKVELNQMCKWQRGQDWVSDETLCDGTGTMNSGLGAEGFAPDWYWSSSEASPGDSDFEIIPGELAWQQAFTDGVLNIPAKFNPSGIRPIRAF